MSNDFEIREIFPCPVYITHRDSDLDLSEMEDIKNIIDKGMRFSTTHSISDNSYIFNTKLKKIKEFCEQHIETYVEKIINPKEELDFYITQSWLNVIKPGESHHQHSHQNSIISGVFYITTVENDGIFFQDPNFKPKQVIKIEQKEFNPINTDIVTMEINFYDLILFPSWLTHGVIQNKEATKDRISLSFNIFARGILGSQESLNQLIL